MKFRDVLKRARVLPVLKIEHAGDAVPLARALAAGGMSLLSDYLALPNVICGGGSWVAPAAAIQAGDWQTITDLARETSS